MQIRKIAISLSILFLIWLPLSCLYAAAWLQPKDKLLTISNTQIYESCQYWNAEGQLKNGSCFFQYALQPYYEYGMTKKFTVVLNPLFDTFYQSSFSVPFGFESLFFAGRYELWQKEWSVISAQFGYNAPVRTGLFGNPAIPISTFALINRTRYLDLRILFGTGGAFDSDKRNTWYFDAEFGYDPNFSGASDEAKINFMLGWKTQNGRLVFELQEWNALRIKPATNALYPNYSLATVMGNIIYWMVPEIVAFQLGIQQDFWGNNIGQGTAPFISLWWRFS
ncbi:MAG TPA: hypothetical protein VHD33_05875 [Legionellaceae bacterium]|nr:hypothetical protein [Legionellaceae bacterium]